MKFKLLFFTLFILLNFHHTKAQSKQDSLYQKATLDVYEHPNESIKIGWELYHKTNNSRRKINALLLISTAYSSKRDYENALKYAVQANEMSEESNDVLSQLKVLSKMAAQYHQMTINDKALQCLDQFDEKSKTYPYSDSIQMTKGNNFGLRGFIYRDKLNCDIAIQYFDKALHNYQINPENKLMKANISVILYNKGNCYISLNQLQNAKTSFLQSIESAQSVNAKSLMAFSQKGLAEVYTLEKQYDQSLTMLQAAQTNAEEVGDLVLNKGIYKGLADNYLALNDWENFQNHYKNYKEFEEKIKIEERISISKSLASHQKEIRHDTQKLKKKALVFSVGLIMLSLILLFSIFISQRKYRQKIHALKHRMGDISNISHNPTKI